MEAPTTRTTGNQGVALEQSVGLPVLTPNNLRERMPSTITKGQIVKAVSDLPDDATLDDAIERLLFLSKIEQGLEQARRGETISHEEVRRRLEEKMASWQK